MAGRRLPSASKQLVSASQYHWMMSPGSTGNAPLVMVRIPAITDARSEGVAAFLQGNSQRLSTDSARRKATFERGNGVFTDSQTDGTVKYNGKKEVAYPKALKPRKDGKKVIGDELRAFARALSGARPFEKFDVLIGRQSM